MEENNVEQHQPLQELSEDITLKQLYFKGKTWFNYLKAKWLIICLAGLIGGAIGFLYASSQKWTYTAVLTFALEDEKGSGGLGGALGLASSFGFDIGTSAGGAFSGANLMELMKSRSLVEKTLLNPVSINGKKISLAEYYIDFTDMRKGLNKYPELKDIHFLPDSNRTNYTIQKDSILGSIYEALTKDKVSVTQKSTKVSIISIEVKTGNELFSKFFSEELAKEVSNFYVETKSKKARLNVNILERQTDSIRRELSGAISGVASANDNTYNLNPALNIKRVPSLQRQIDVQANTAILTQLVTNLELARVTLRKETPLIQVIDKPILPLSKEKLSKRKSVIQGGFLAGLLVVAFLSTRRWWKELTAKW